MIFATVRRIGITRTMCNARGRNVTMANGSVASKLQVAMLHVAIKGGCNVALLYAGWVNQSTISSRDLGSD